MHEMSIAMDVCRIAQERAGAETAALTAVAVEVGDDCGLEPESLEFCLEVLLKQPPFRNAKPVLLKVSGDVLRVSYLEVDDGSPDD
jgi:Zn finger protein HypA/HybF involved in hydrogenase expression